MKNETKQTEVCPCDKKKKIAVVAAFAVVAALLFGMCGGHCGCGGKTMTIDFDRMQRETVAYKTVIEQHKSHLEKLQAELGLEAGALQQEAKELAEQKAKMSDAEYKKKRLNLQKKDAELQNKYQFQAQQIELATQTAAAQLQPEVNEVIQKVAKKAGATIILNKAVTFDLGEVGAKSDLTDAVIKALNDKVKPVQYPDPETVKTEEE